MTILRLKTAKPNQKKIVQNYFINLTDNQFLQELVNPSKAVFILSNQLSNFPNPEKRSAVKQNFSSFIGYVTATLLFTFKNSDNSNNFHW